MYWPSILSIAVILYLIGSLRVLRQYERGVVFLLGKFEGVRGPGLTLIFIPIQQMVRVSLRTVTMQIPSQKIKSMTCPTSASGHVARPPVLIGGPPHAATSYRTGH